MSALVTSALIAGASSLAAAGGSSIAASKMNARAEKYNRWALKEQQRYQKEYADYMAQLEAQQNNLYWDKYNSPAAQRRARVAAGLTPYADVGGIQTSSVDPGSYGGSTPSAQSFSQPGGIPTSPLVGAFGNATQQTLSALQAEANIELTKSQALRKNVRAKHYHVTFEPLFDDPGTVDLSGINWIVVGTMTGVQSRKVHTEPEWAWSLTDQAHALGIPVFMKEDLVPIIGDENMIQEMPEEFNKVLEVQKSWKK